MDMNDTPQYTVAQKYYAVLGGLFILASGLLLVSCDMMSGDFLDRDARGSVSEDVIAGKNGGVDALLVGAYDALTGVDEAGASIGGGAAWESAQDNWIYGTVTGGEAYKGSIGGDQAPILTFAKMQHTAASTFLDSKWKTLYEGISRSNAVLRVLPKVEDLTEEEKAVREGEARFLRAHFYFDLKRHFGNVPWVDETTESFRQPNTGPDHPDVWAKIEEDLTFAMNNLPGPAGKADAGRADALAAQAYLGKVHLYQEEWDAALSELEAVINSGAYSLTPKYQDMFNAATENNSGSIFAVQNTGDDGSGGIGNSRGGAVLNYPHGGNSPFGCCGFYQPSQWLVNSFRVDDDGHPILDRTQGQHVKNDYGVGAGEPYSLGTQPLDPRLEWTVGRRGIPYHDWGPHPGDRWIRDQAVGGPYAPKKHVYRQRNEEEFGASNAWGAVGSGINYKVIRYADVLLMAAEAQAELGQGDLGLSYVNMVRNRAANPESQITNAMNEDFALAVVDSEDAMLATEPDAFDWVVRTDRNSTFVFLGGDPGNIDNWNEYVLPDYSVEPYGSFAGQQDALEKIRFERMLELGMEGHRFYDLARWGTAGQELGDYYDFEVSGNGGYEKENLQGAEFTENKNEVYPIPQRQIDVIGEEILEQNPGYN